LWPCIGRLLLRGLFLWLRLLLVLAICGSLGVLVLLRSSIRAGLSVHEVPPEERDGNRSRDQLRRRSVADNCGDEGDTSWEADGSEADLATALGGAAIVAVAVVTVGGGIVVVGRCAFSSGLARGGLSLLLWYSRRGGSRSDRCGVNIHGIGICGSGCRLLLGWVVEHTRVMLWCDHFC